MSDFITLTGASNAPALIRIRSIVTVTQDSEYPDRRRIEYVAGDKLLTLHVQNIVGDIATRIREAMDGEE